LDDLFLTSLTQRRINEFTSCSTFGKLPRTQVASSFDFNLRIHAVDRLRSHVLILNFAAKASNQFLTSQDNVCK